MAVKDIIDIWASPSKIPTKIYFISSGINIPALSKCDKRLTPLVERIAKRTRLVEKKNDFFFINIIFL